MGIYERLWAIFAPITQSIANVLRIDKMKSAHAYRDRSHDTPERRGPSCMLIVSGAWPFRQVIEKAEAARRKISQPVSSRDGECAG